MILTILRSADQLFYRAICQELKVWGGRPQSKMSFSSPYNKGAYCQRDLITVVNLHHGAAGVLGFKTICVVSLTPPTLIFVAPTFLNSRFLNPVPCSTAPLGAFSHNSCSELASGFPHVLQIYTCCHLSHSCFSSC